MTDLAARRPTSAAMAGFEDFRSRVLGRPAEGWLTLAGAIAMLIALGASYVNAGWTPSWAGDSGFLLYVGSVGLAFGFMGAKIGWGRWRTHFVGALFAGLFLPLIAGGLVLEARGTPVGWDPGALALRMATAWDIASNVWTELVVLRLPTTFEAAHYHMIFGGLIWGAGQLAGYTIFGHRRPLDAVVVLGLILLANIALTGNDQEVFLVAFSAAALALLIRTHVFEEEVTWARRKIGDPAAVGRLYLNGGIAFVTAAVLGSVLLMAAASSDPLQGLFKDLPKHLQGISQFLQAIAPGGGNMANPGGTTFGSSVTSSGQWNPSSGIAFQAQLPAGEDATFKWRAGTYARFNTLGWAWAVTDPAETATVAGGPLLNGSGEEDTLGGRREITIAVFPDSFRDQTIVGPNAITSVDKPTVVRTVGSDGWFTTVESTEDLAPYTVSALIPIIGDAQGGLTEARLRAAGVNYPDDIRNLYLQLPEDAVGPNARALLQAIRAAAQANELDPGNPFDLAKTMEVYLSSASNFAYSANIRTQRDTICGRVSMAECFATIKAGYCEYYATTMAVLLRDSGVPARIAYGYLSGGERDGNNVEVVEGHLAHWWVEAYFPGVGWVEFDPTGGSIGQPQPLPSGSLGPATPRPTLGLSTQNAIPSFPTGAPPINTPSGTGIGPFIAIGLILLVGFGALAFATYRRAPSKPMDPEHAWGSLARLAARFGLGPRPSQTVYEYAGALGDELPTARVELTTIARAKVEVAYGHRTLDTDSLKRIALAFHRLRLAIFGVVLRRGLRRGRGR
jgi:transglutaminase-like putative cysteine protease